MHRMIVWIFVLGICITSNAVYSSCPKPRNTTPCGNFIDAVEDQNVQVIARGDTLRLILPADVFFKPASSKLKENKGVALNEVAQLLNCHCYAISNMHISGYTDTVGKIKEQQQRSLQQARNIAAYLWANGVDLNRMHVRGYGQRRTLSSNGTPDGSADNRRVEITLP